ncbi:MAG TPA: carbohydrate-binding family 9-like protein [bacterium]|nr:carbohydrate-binding family 9-like protein [bacterium]
MNKKYFKKVVNMFIFYLFLNYPVISEEIPRIRIPFFQDNVIIDGNIEEDVWKKAVSTGPFYLLGGKEIPTQESEAVIWHNGKRIFVAFICKEKDIDKLEAKVIENDKQVWNDDCVELFVSPFSDADPYYHFVANTLGIKYDEKRIEEGSIDIPEWGGSWEVQSRVFSDKYIVEMSIPFGLFDNFLSSDWRISFSRENKINGELSVWPPMGKERGFHNPEKFAFLEGVNAQISSVIKVENAKFLFLSRENGLINGNLIIDFSNQGDGKTYILNFLLSGVDNFYHQEQKEIFFSSGKTELNFPISLIKEGEYKIKCELKEGDEIVYFWQDEVEVPPLSFSVSLLKPYYRNSIFPSQKISSIIIKIENLSSNSLLKGTIKIKGKDNKEIVQKSFSFKGKEKEISIPIPDLKVGEYFIQIKSDKGEMVIPLKKLSPTEGTEVWIDENNNFVVKGKPVFPLGFYSVSSCVNYKKSGYNFIFSYSLPSKETLEWLEENQAWEFASTIGLFTHARSSQLNQAGIQKVQDLISQNPYRIVGWYCADEPEIHKDLNRSAYRDALKLMRDMDPYRPISVVHDTTGGIKLDKDLTDIIMMDPYLGFEKNKNFPMRPLERISIFIDEAVKSCGNKKPVWAVLQCFPSGYFGGDPEVSRYPTIQEIRAMTYLSLIHGAKGIIYWAFSSSSSNLLDVPALWSALKEFSSEIHYLEPVLLSSYEVNWSKIKSVHYLKKELNGVEYIFAVNTRNTRDQIDIPVDKNTYWVLSENRQVKGDGNKITDEFAPYQTHIYISQPVPDLPFRKTLENFREEDAWIGVSGSENLALGWEGGKIKVSSCNPYRCSFAAIDGGYISDWLSYNDNSPYVEINLRKKSNIKRIRLVFSPQYLNKISYNVKYFSDNNWHLINLKEPKIYHLFWDDEINKWVEFSPEQKGISLCQAVVHEYEIDIPETEAFRIEFSSFGHLAEFGAYEK